ncbi:MAG: carboxy-terminal-processing protease, carboxyl-terminal processing protease [Candidatus Parcubacteria bacterium]|jgi:carboxyl-terminal processing protease
MLNQDAQWSSKNEQTQSERKQWLPYSLALLLAIATFFSGLYIGERGTVFGQDVRLSSFISTDAGATAETDLSQFWKVWGILNEKFVSASTTQQLSDNERVYGAISGLVDSYGDPYTIFMPPSDADRFEDDISGNFSGVGMEVGLRDRLITIISPLPGTPAERAGLLSGDVIVKIDDKSTEDMRIDEAVRLIRGEKGTTVTFEIFREGETEFRIIPVVRDNIDIPTVKTEKINDIFVISLYSFNAVAESKMQEAMDEFTASKAEKLVIDLRGNPGGFMQSAVDIGSFFMPAGKVVVREQSGEGGEDKIFRTRNRQVREFSPQNLVVLVDGGSASASEILAGALKDHQTATIIGDQTFGKGSVQELIELPDGSSLKVTIARWLTPNGVSISHEGLAPDILIKRTPQHREAGEDPQKDAALRFLRGEEVISESFTDALKTTPGA